MSKLFSCCLSDTDPTGPSSTNAIKSHIVSESTDEALIFRTSVADDPYPLSGIITVITSEHSHNISYGQEHFDELPKCVQRVIREKLKKDVPLCVLFVVKMRTYMATLLPVHLYHRTVGTIIVLKEVDPVEASSAAGVGHDNSGSLAGPSDIQEGAPSQSPAPPFHHPQTPSDSPLP